MFNFTNSEIDRVFKSPNCCYIEMHHIDVMDAGRESVNLPVPV